MKTVHVHRWGKWEPRLDNFCRECKSCGHWEYALSTQILRLLNAPRPKYVRVGKNEELSPDETYYRRKK